MSYVTRLLSLFGAAVASLLLAVPAAAQVTTADITGRVLDQNGAAVANVTVTARNIATGQERTTQSDERGQYTLAELPPGTYDITAEAPNFSKAVLKAREINVGTTLTLNFDLKPGEITEIVNVTADSLLQIETTRSDLGGVVTPMQVENLPLLNRTFAALSVIMPEARPVGNFDPTKTRVGNVAFNGGD
ncbi:MAG TPA: carboxypeptidase-like regulatory domain-containing protein, partial [Pyrinomonadaceae bacterium]|nr:carboxypeptidase-like regulatory domain-containing protein [Pyrinomonadaceae bacterium]